MSAGEGQGNSEKELSPNQDEILKKLKELEADRDRLSSTNQRLLEESKKFKEKAQTFEQKELEERDRIKRLEEEKLRSEGQYKILLEQREKERDALISDRDNEKREKEKAYNTLTEARKLSAFQNRLGGKLKSQKLLDFVDTEEIAINPDTGEFDQQSVDSVVKKFLGEFKEMVDFGNNRLPAYDTGNGKNIGLKDWAGMNTKDKKENLAGALEAYKRLKK